MYATGGEHPHRGVCREFLAKAVGGRVQAVTSVEVLQEILHRYVSLGRIDFGCDVYDQMVEACPKILEVKLQDLYLARDLLCQYKGISARDAIHAAVMLNNGIQHIATFDKGFDCIPGIKRLPFA
jgi:predicted nucleic acid-binding protein